MKRYCDYLDRLGETGPWSHMSMRRRVWLAALFILEAAVVAGAAAWFIHSLAGCVIAAVIWSVFATFFVLLVLEPGRALSLFARGLFVLFVVVAVGWLLLIAFGIAVR